MVLLNWQKSVARLTGVAEGEEEREEEGAGNRAARKTIDGQSEQERERERAQTALISFVLYLECEC